MTRNNSERNADWRGQKCGILLFALLAIGLPMASGAEKRVITDKTLVAWAAPADLTQRGGSVLTIEKSRGVFDAIVFGEIMPGKWMAGSNGFTRTNKEQQNNPHEIADPKKLVQIAIVYRGNQITIYRNGNKYTDYSTEGQERFTEERMKPTEYSGITCQRQQFSVGRR